MKVGSTLCSCNTSGATRLPGEYTLYSGSRVRRTCPACLPAMRAPARREGLLGAGKGRGGRCAWRCDVPVRARGRGGEGVQAGGSVSAWLMECACMLDAKHAGALSAHSAELSARCLAHRGRVESCNAVCGLRLRGTQAVMPEQCRRLLPAGVFILRPPREGNVPQLGS
jgi:hypothetical protein